MSNFVRLQCGYPTNLPGVTVGEVNLFITKAEFYKVRNTPGFYSGSVIFHVNYPDGTVQSMRVRVMNTVDVPDVEDVEGEGWKQ